MHIATPVLQTKNKIFPNLATINTTLYDLIEVINEEVKPSNDRLVTAIISDLYYRGIIKSSDVRGKEQADGILSLKVSNQQ